MKKLIILLILVMSVNIFADKPNRKISYSEFQYSVLNYKSTGFTGTSYNPISKKIPMILLGSGFVIGLTSYAAGCPPYGSQDKGYMLGVYFCDALIITTVTWLLIKNDGD